MCSLLIEVWEVKRHPYETVFATKPLDKQNQKKNKAPSRNQVYLLPSTTLLSFSCKSRGPSTFHFIIAQPLDKHTNRKKKKSAIEKPRVPTALHFTSELLLQVSWPQYLSFHYHSPLTNSQPKNKQSVIEKPRIPKGGCSSLP